MFTWAKVILAVLSLIEWMVRIGQENKWIAVGEQRQIAAANAEILRKTEYSRAALEEVKHLSDDQLDDFLRSFEPSSDRQPLLGIPTGDPGKGGRGDQG